MSDFRAGGQASEQAVVTVDMGGIADRIGGQVSGAAAFHHDGGATSNAAASNHASVSASGAAIPDREALESELVRERRRNRLFSSLGTTALVLAAAVSALVILAVLVFPILRVSGSSMTETLVDGDVVVAMKPADYATGDLVAFNHNNEVVAKRVIACGGQWVDIDEEGFVSVDGTRLEEPYVSNRARGECTVTLPYQVPDGRLFVMGDHRLSSVDSRSASFGCVTSDQVVGKLLWRAWPISHAGLVA